MNRIKNFFIKFKIQQSMKNLSFDNFSSEKKLSPERKRYITSLARKALVNTLETF